MNDIRHRIADFLVDYAWLIDNDKLEEWANLFAPDGRYEVIPRENVDRGMPLALMSCKNQAMIRDRILALRVANEYNVHYDRHIISPAKIMEMGVDTVRIEANFLVVQTDQGGNSKVFSAGTYRDLLYFDEERLLIKEKLAIVDTFCVPTLIATPI